MTLQFRRVAGGLQQLAPGDRAACLMLARPAAAPPRKPRPAREPAAQVRRWAVEQGVPCPRSGPIPATVRAAYDEAAQHRWRDSLAFVGAWLADTIRNDRRTGNA